MNKIALLASDELKDLFKETAAVKGINPAIAEKDFWVCWTLNKLFSHGIISRRILFKGGTSLSKVFKLIERFSEDIDLVLDWRLFTEENPEEQRSKSKQEKLNEEINHAAAQYISGDLLRMVKDAVAPVCAAEAAEKDPHIINIRYPMSFSDKYILPDIRLEIGPLASWIPNDEYTIKPYAAEVFPALFDKPDCTIRAVTAERTFWEKVTILHQEAHRPKGTPQPPRYSRHYYDLSRMANSKIKRSALDDLPLLEAVVEFKKRFYPRKWANYENAKQGTIKLIPSEETLASLMVDYIEMRNMIFGEYPAFEEIIDILRRLESEINS